MERAIARRAAIPAENTTTMPVAAQLLIQGSKFLIQGSMQGLDFGLRCGIFGEMFRPRRRAANKSNSHLSLRRIWRPNGRGRVEWPPTEHFSVSE